MAVLSPPQPTEGLTPPQVATAPILNHELPLL